MKSVRPVPARKPHAWYVDAVAAVAFIVVALVCGKAVSRALGPFVGIFFLAFTAGFGYLFGRAAWNEFFQRRDGAPRR